MKKASLCLAFLFAILLSSCSGTKAKSENQIRQEIEEHYLWKDLNVNITSFSVEKRQTNQDAKEDIVYITMTGENDSYTAEQFYIATYHLYNEGWILDSLEKNQDNAHFSTVTPTKGVDISEAQELLESFWDLSFGSFDVYRADINSPIEAEQYLSENYGRDMYTVECRYYYDLFTEVVQFPIVFTFEYLNPDVGYGWTGYVDVKSAVRTLELNDGILGSWEDTGWQGPFYANVTFSDLNGDSCWCEFSSYTYNGSIYITDTKNYSGWISLHYSFNTDTGNIRDVELVFDSDEGTFECVSGEYLTMQARSWSGRGYVTSHRALEFHKRASPVSTQVSEGSEDMPPELTAGEIREQVLFAIEACLDNPSLIEDTQLLLTEYKDKMVKLKGSDFEDCYYIENICDGIAASDLLWAIDDAIDYVEYIYGEDILNLCKYPEGGNLTYSWQTEFCTKLVNAYYVMKN